MVSLVQYRGARLMVTPSRVPRRHRSSMHCWTERPVLGCSQSREGLLRARDQGEARGF